MPLVFFLYKRSDAGIFVSFSNSFPQDVRSGGNRQKSAHVFVSGRFTAGYFFVVERALPLAAVVALLFQGRSAAGKLCVFRVFSNTAESGLPLAYIQSESGLSLANVMSEGGLAPANLLIESGLALANVLFQSGSSLATVCLLFRW